jgi:glycosyltransferase involved in cell wall biosynthesis/GNAT superfamily N-acetyltransferase
VLWVIKGLGPGGAERLLAGAAAKLTASQVDLTCAYVVAVKRHLVPEMEAAGVGCVCVSTRARDALWPLRLVRIVRRGGFEVVHVHSPLPGSIARLAARTLPCSRRPMVLTTEHNSWATYCPVTRLVNRITSRWDRHTFAVSEEAADSLKGPAAQHVSVLTHGVPVQQVRARLAERDRLRAVLGVTPDTLVFGTVANFREQKDYPNLLRACDLLVQRGTPVRVVAVGQGPLEAEVRALQHELGLDDVVTLLGYRADAIDVLAACDAFVLGSRWEGLPVALMEACALGLPSVLTDVGGMRAALGDAGALWVPAAAPEALAAAMAELAADPALRARLAAAARAAAPLFDDDRAVAELRRWYLAQAPLPAPVPKPAAGITVRRATAADLPAILELCRKSLGWADGDWDGFYRWKHCENPFGKSPTWVAEADGRIVGLRAFMRWRFDRDGRTVQAARAVDTATDPEFRGKRLFTALTLGALPELRAEGIDMVFNTPNTSSRPGYLKMGWQDVGRLPPVLRPMALRKLPAILQSRVPADHWPVPITIGRSVEEWLADDAGAVLPGTRGRSGVRTVIDADFARWRFGSPLQPSRVVGRGDLVAVVQVRRRGQITELVGLAGWGNPGDIDRLLVASAREAGADVIIRLGPAKWRSGYIHVPRTGPRLACLMLADEPAPPFEEWHLSMGDVALF